MSGKQQKQTQLIVKISGRNLHPGEMSARDMGKFFVLLEEMLEAVVVDRHPMLKSGEVHIGLCDIHAGSVTLEFTTHHIPVYDAFLDISHAIATNTFEQLPRDGHCKLFDLSEFLKQRQCSAELSITEETNQLRSLACITPNTEIPDPEEYNTLQGGTTLYGRIIWIGGTRNPRIEVQTYKGKVNCYATKEQVKQLGAKLFEEIGLRGTAFWDSRDHSIRKFEVVQILPYRETPIHEAVQQLSQRFGHFFDHIQDPVAWVAQERGQGDQE